MMMSSALVVLRLITRSNLVARRTGKLPGLSPLRMRYAMYLAMSAKKQKAVAWTPTRIGGRKSNANLTGFLVSWPRSMSVSPS
jgi:hypothetical protein